MNLQTLSLRAKLGYSFALMTLLILLVSGFAIKALYEEKTDFHDFVTGINARAQLAQKIRTAVDRRAVAARNLALATKPADRELEKAAVTQAHDDVQKRLSDLKKAVDQPGIPTNVKALVADIEKIEQSYGPVALGIVDLAVADKKEEAIAKINDECRPLLAALIAKTNEYQNTTNERSQQIIENSDTNFEAQSRIFVGLALFSVLVAIASGLLITRGVLRSLGAEPDELGKAASQVASGDLRPFRRSAEAPPGSVLASLAEMQTSLVNVVTRVREGSETVATASTEIAQGNQDLSARTENQASALEEAAASMEELSSTVKQNADNSRQANQLSQKASSVALRGGEVVTQVVETMRDINNSSKKISDIIGVIDGIAFQTNILALNAAVEAARAGEQGRGFAVVASEVRSLAGRSAEAAKEIKLLISTSVEKVEQGTVLVDQAGATMTEIVDSIKRVTDIVGEISAASSEQNTGVGQVSEAVNQIDQATQQNAALVEQMAAAATSLKVQAQELVQTVAVFKLEAQGHASYRTSHQTTTPNKALPRRKGHSAQSLPYGAEVHSLV